MLFGRHNNSIKPLVSVAKAYLKQTVLQPSSLRYRDLKSIFLLRENLLKE